MPFGPTTADTARDQQGTQVFVDVVDHVEFGKAIQIGLGAVYVQLERCGTHADSHQRQTGGQATNSIEPEIAFHSVVIHSLSLSVSSRCFYKRGTGILRSATLRSIKSEEHTSELQSRPHLVCR